MQPETLDTSPLLEAIFQRRSIRRYHQQHVPHEMIKRILEAAIRAPSAHNRQPWRFAVIESEEEKENLAKAMGARLRQDLEADHVPQDVIDNDVNRSYSRITQAPVLIVLCLSMSDMDVYRDARRNDSEYLMAVQSTAMAGQNLLLAAHDAGLGGCWMCAPLFVPALVREKLALPKDWQPQALITLGYPAETRTKERHDLESSVLWR